MGVPLMTLYLVEVKQAGMLLERQFCKNITEAKRLCKQHGAAGARLREYGVTLTKDGVLEALNRCPFRGAGRVVENSPSGPVASGTCRGPSEVLPSPRAKGQLPSQRPDPEDEGRLAGRHPEYIRGWNLVKRSGLGRRRAV